MKKILFAMIAGATALSGMSAANAADAGTAYVGAGVVGSHYDIKVPGAISGDDNNGDKATGKVFAGYNIDKTWAVEGGYTDFGSKGYDYTNGATGAAGSIHTDAHSLYVAGKGTLPINEQFNVFGKLGAARNHNSVDATGDAAGLNGSGSKTALYASVGGEYLLNKNVSFSLEYENYGKNDIDVGRKTGAITAGVRYNF